MTQDPSVSEPRLGWGRVLAAILLFSIVGPAVGAFLTGLVANLTVSNAAPHVSFDAFVFSMFVMTLFGFIFGFPVALLTGAIFGFRARFSRRAGYGDAVFAASVACVVFAVGVIVSGLGVVSPPLIAFKNAVLTFLPPAIAAAVTCRFLLRRFLIV